jgi:hypothetical protein
MRARAIALAVGRVAKELTGPLMSQFNCCHVVRLSGCKLILGQIIGQAELLIPLILRWDTNKDLVVSRVRVEVVVFPIPLHQRRHFIWRQRLEMLLPFWSVIDDRSEARSRESGSLFATY